MSSGNHKTKIIIFLWLAFILIGTIYVSLALWWNSLSPISARVSVPQTIKSSPDLVKNTPTEENNGWQNYENTDYGFQIQYPISIGNPSQAFADSEVIFGTSGLSVQMLHKNGQNFYDSTLTNKNGECLIGATAFFSFKDAEKIGGETAYHYVNYPNMNQRFCFNPSECFYYDIYRIFNDGNCYEIVYQRNGAPMQIPDTIIQMISSFKFAN